MSSLPVFSLPPSHPLSQPSSADVLDQDHPCFVRGVEVPVALRDSAYRGSAILPALGGFGVLNCLLLPKALGVKGDKCLKCSTLQRTGSECLVTSVNSAHRLNNKVLHFFYS